ncbi:PREDICTED: uncharacterized protein LOC109151178 [Ipomoea nil]|uniref:uncharacterized protein LOC109151178 n=1 Tax=Ipomoea nil TaxID=35883 RepID=UPI0009012335|nr:PREDICTED: uncharacterized protein LOC109151178 [Ipomoea nil]
MAVWDFAMPSPLHLCRAFHNSWASWTASEARLRIATSASDTTPLPAEAIHAPPLPPPVDTVYCSTDAGFSGPDRSPTFGFYVRSMDGAFVAAASGPLACPYDPLLAEAMAIHEALSWLQEHNYHNVQILSDCAVLVASFRDAGSYRSYLGIVLDSCLRLINSFPACSVKFVRRGSNLVAHALAKHVSAVEARTVWRDSLPPFISPAMI